MLMYLFDPDRGRARRAVLHDRTMHGLRGGWRRACDTSADAAHRAYGGLVEHRSRSIHEVPSNEQLVERVRAEMGHVIRHPRRVTVAADAGWVRLTGHVLPDEKENLVTAISKVPGVFGIEDDVDERGWLASEGAVPI